MFDFAVQRYMVDCYCLKKELEKRIDLGIFAKANDITYLRKDFRERLWSDRMIEAIMGTDGNPFRYIDKEEMENRIEDRWNEWEDCDKVVFKTIIEMMDNGELPEVFYLIDYDF